MMRQNNIEMTTTIKRQDLLNKLRTNLESHSKIVKEAREGYVKQAREALEHRLRKIIEGSVVDLMFQLHPPQDYSDVYKNSIAMLEWNTKDEIELGADEFRQLVLDEWNWSSSFYGTNKQYSVGAMSFSQQKGY